MSFLQSLERCCPDTIMSCFRTIALKLNKKSSSKKKKEASTIHHLEEEEFQFTPSHKFYAQEQSQVKIKDKKQLRPSAFQVEESLDIKINLTPMHDVGAEPQQNSALLRKQIQELSSIREYNFKLNLQPFSQFYEIIQNKTHNLRQTFQQNNKTMLKRTQKSMVTIRQIETLTGFKLIISYRLPCSYSFYSKINKNEQLVMNVCKIISSNKIIQVIQPNLAVVELRFTKFMLLEPRFFRYVKYENSTSSSHWQVCVSTKNRPDVQMKEKQCELTSISCFEQDTEGLTANIYLEVDLKSNIKATKVVQRVYQELANYLDSIYQYVKSHYSEESA